MLSSLRPLSSMLTRGVAAVVQHSREQRRKKVFGCPLPRLPVVAGKAQSSPPTARGNIEGNGARGRPSRRKKEQLYRHQAVLDIQRLTTSILNMLQTLFRQPNQSENQSETSQKPVRNQHKCCCWSCCFCCCHGRYYRKSGSKNKGSSRSSSSSSSICVNFMMVSDWFLSGLSWCLTGFLTGEEDH